MTENDETSTGCANFIGSRLSEEVSVHALFRPDR